MTNTKKKKRILLKLGSNTLTRETDQISRGKIEDIARQIALLKDEYEFVLISSGAVAVAKPAAILILCTNLDGAAVASEIEAETGVPVLDSVVVTLWGALRATNRPTAGLAPWGRALSRIPLPQHQHGQYA